MNNATFFSQQRSQFPALSRNFSGQPAVFFDGPAGTQVPQRVIDAVSNYYATMNANHEGLFPTSRETDAMLDEAHRACADFVGSDDPDTIVFGANMTSLTFALSRSLAREWQPQDEIIVTRLDHDANVSPWVMAATDAGAKVHFVDLHRTDCTLDLEDFRAKLSPRTKLVAVGCASNSVGTINPVHDLCRWSREVGALTFLDAVHFAPHRLIDVAQFDCDFLACSAYKFFGPHIGILWGRRELLDRLTAYKVRPASDALPDKWMSGTQNHECLAGVIAAINYLADVGRALVPGQTDRRPALAAAFQAIETYEQSLLQPLIEGIQSLKGFTIWGITDPAQFAQRAPTISITHRDLPAATIAEQLGSRGIFVWHGNYYALELSEALEQEPQGMVRIGLIHYNTREEVDRLIQELRNITE